MSLEKNIHLHLFSTFFKIGAFTFGGGYAMIALLDKECIEKNSWLKPDELLNITAIAESTPGPIAINCATYTGYKMAGLWGAISATLGIVLPSIITIYFICMCFENLLEYQLVRNIFHGIQVGVSLVILQAGINMIKKSMKKLKKKIIPIIHISLCFMIVLICNLMGIYFSAIYLILIAAVAGYFLYNSKVSDTEDGGNV